jgi:hypothetical protein
MPKLSAIAVLFIELITAVAPARIVLSSAFF